MHSRLIIGAIALFSLCLAEAKEHFAYHSQCVSRLTLPWQAAFDATKTETAYFPPVLYDQTDRLDLVGQVVDEVMMTVTFNPGTTPAIDEVVSISYGNEIVLGPSSHNLRFRVQNQDLHIWYGFHDQADSHQSFPKITTKADWSFRVKGHNTVNSVMFYVSWHSSAESEMPSLHAYDSLRRLWPSDSELLKAESPSVRTTIGSPVEGTENYKKVIVLIHGWNPEGNKNHYAAAKEEENQLGTWRPLTEGLMAHPAVTSGDWTVCRYDWALDAATGGANLLAAYNANAARDAASAHALKLGGKLLSLNPSHVQFIAHSAGNWMALRAAAHLKFMLGSAVQIQMTCLDPFVNDDLGLVPMFELCSGWTDRLNNCWVADSKTDTIDGWRLYGRDALELKGDWTSGDYDSPPSETAWQNLDIRTLGDPGFFFLDQGMKSHGGPVSWYAQTAIWPNTVNSAIFDPGSGWYDGFVDSLACRLSDNDNFPGENLGSATQGSKTWVNIHATREGAEPIWSGMGTIWATWTAPAAGQVKLSVVGSEMADGSGVFDLPTITVYQGNTATAVSTVASNIEGNISPQEQVLFSAVAGEIYRVQLAGYGGGVGKVALSWSMDGVSPPNTPLVTAPTANQTVTGTVAVDASATSANAVEFYLDGIKQHRDEAPPFSWSWNTLLSASGSHHLSVKSFNGQTLVGTSASVVVNVNNTVTPVVDVDEPNDRSTQATGPLASGTMKTAKINSPSDVDWYRFDVTQPGTFSFRLNVPSGNDFDLELYGQNNTWLAGSYKGIGSAGNLDLSFNKTGSRQINLAGFWDYCSDIAVQADGKIVIIGGIKPSNRYIFAVIRLTPEGDFDNSFNGTGVVTTDFGIPVRASAVAIQPDGKIVVAGRSEVFNGDLIVARYLNDGSADLSFNGSGKVTTTLGGGDYASDLLVQPDGKILVVGTTEPTGESHFAAARYLPDGSLDTSFDGDGVLVTDFGTFSRGMSVALMNDGRFVIGGSGNGYPYDFAVARYHPNGSLDTNFNGTGKLLTTITPSSSESGGSIAVQADGKILIGGESYYGSQNHSVLLRYNDNGTSDTSWAASGVLVLSDEIPSGQVLLLPDQRILFGSHLRFLGNGTRDTSYNPLNIISPELGPGLALQPDGKLVTCQTFSQDFLVARAQMDRSSIESILISVSEPGTYYARVYGYPAGNGSFSATDPYTLSYTFMPGLVTQTHSLETIASDGMVQRSNPGPNHSEGQTVMLTPVPNPGFQFAGWSGDASGTANPLSVTMSADKKIVATFTPVASTSFQANVTVNLEPPEAVAAGAQWRLVSDGVWRNSGATAAVSTQGIQTVEFKATTGYFSPGKQTVSVNRAAGDLSLTGAYRLKAVDAGSGFLDVGDLPPTLSCIEGQSASLTAQAAGTGTLTYQWFLGAYPVEGATSATLILTNVETGLVGEKFSCVVSNGTLSKQTNGCELIMLSPPVISQHPAAASLPAGGTASFRVVATGTSPFRYQWKKAGVDIAGATSEFLRLNNLQSGDAASYTVVISNDAGSATSNAAALSVTGSAPAPSGNDSFAGASLIPDAAITQTGNNASATREPNEPLVSGSVGGHSLWWRWTAPSSGRVTITTEGSDFDSTLGVYIGNVLNALALLAEDDDSGGRAITSTVSFDTVAGQTYNIAVDGHDAADTGNIQLRIDLSPTASPALAPVTAIHEVLAAVGQTTLGIKPQAFVQAADGSLYVCYGDGGPYSFGSVVKHNLDGSSVLMHAFTFTDGSYPNRIIQASDGNFYGTTMGGELNGFGGVFRMTPGGEVASVAPFIQTSGHTPRWLSEGADGRLYVVAGLRGTSTFGSVLRCLKAPGSSLSTFFQPTTSPNNGNTPVHLLQLSDGSFALTCSLGATSNRGSVLFISSAGVMTQAVLMTTTSGHVPQGVVETASGDLWGLARSGTSANAGSIFSLTRAGVLSVLHAFSSASPGNVNGHRPTLPPVLGPDGKLYGSVDAGGSSNFGAVVSYDAGNGLQKLRDFSSSTASIGAVPGYLALGNDGNLYGLTVIRGPNNAGTLFGLNNSGTVVFSKPFGGVQGSAPSALTEGQDGNIYWMNVDGGASNAGEVMKFIRHGSSVTSMGSFDASVNGNPTLLPARNSPFILLPDGQLLASVPTGIMRVNPLTSAIARLATFNNSIHGWSPGGGLLRLSDGTVYGATTLLAANSIGSLFSFTEASGVTSLVPLSSSTTGSAVAGLTEAANGNVYYVAQSGPSTFGGVFHFNPAGSATAMATMSSSATYGHTPTSLMRGNDGYLYGTTRSAGAGAVGGIFRFDPSTSSLSHVTAMTTATGASPEGPLIQEEDGSLIGTAPTGGTFDGGTLFKTSLAGDVTVLHHFEETSGHNPQYGVIRGSDGDLYGGTYHQYGVATIYRVTYLPPEILSILPAQAPPGAAITITGKHFAKTSRVQFGNLDAPSFSLDSNTQITAVVPAGFRAGSISITNPLGTGTSAAYSAPALSNLQLWREAYFGTSESADVANDLADLEGDGVKNLAEFAFGMNPYAGGQQDRMPKGLAATHNSQSYLAISFRRRISETSIAYEVEESDNLSTWTTLNILAQQVGLPVNNGDGTETVTVRATVPMEGPGSQPKCFLRVTVRRTP